MTTLAAGSPPAREPLKGVRKPSACWQNCGGRCLNKVFIVGNSIIRQKTDDSHPDSADYPQQRGCLRGRSQRRHVLGRSEEHTSELQSLMRISYAVFCLKKKNK